jgi:hypothetical protein
MGDYMVGNVVSGGCIIAIGRVPPVLQYWTIYCPNKSQKHSQYLHLLILYLDNNHERHVGKKDHLMCQYIVASGWYSVTEQTG